MKLLNLLLAIIFTVGSVAAAEFDDNSYDYLMPYPSKGKGKGKGGSTRKKTKSSKSKSSKISKSTKGMYCITMSCQLRQLVGIFLIIINYNLVLLLFLFSGDQPSAPSPSEPTTEPFFPTPTTPSPTSANSIPIRALPYALSYSPSGSVPSTTDYAQLSEVTRIYLEEFMVAEFSQTSLTNLDDFVTFMTRNEFEGGQPVISEYRSTGLFNPSSIFLPTVRELNQLVSEAFNSENMPEYLKRVRSLPSSNPLSSTETITFQQLDEVRKRRLGSLSSLPFSDVSMI
jgi:hypothetical protein